MKSTLARAVLTVFRAEGLWLAEYDGEHFGHAADKEIVIASAHRRAREMMDRGCSCQVIVLPDVNRFKTR